MQDGNRKSVCGKMIPMIPEKAAGKLENLLGCAREIDKDLRNAAEQGAELFTVEVRNFHVPAHKSKW